MKDHDLTAWLDGELDDAEAQAVEQELAQDPQRLTEVATLIREQFLMAETFIEEAQAASSDSPADCPECEAVEPDVSMLPNEEIFTAYVGGQLTDEQAQEVELQIESDPVFKRELAEFCRQRFQMAEILEGEGAEEDQAAGRVLNFPTSAPTHAGQGRSAIMESAKSGGSWVKIAAVLAILATGAWFLAQEFLFGPNGPQVVAVELKATIGDPVGEVSIIRDSKQLPVSDAFVLKDGDTLVTGSGKAVVIYQDGTSIQLRSYARLELNDEDGAKQLSLKHGLASADVTPQPDGKPMVIGTSIMDVEVVGTAFLLEASRGESRLEMTEGKVTVTHIATGRTSGAKAGQSITASADKVTLSDSKPRVVSFSLIDTETKQAVPGYDPILPDAAIPLSTVQGRQLTLRANTIPKIMDEVKLKLLGPKGYPQLSQTENFYPYLLTVNKSQNHWVDAEIYEAMPEWVAGSYSITAEAKTGGEDSTAHSLSFEVRP